MKKKELEKQVISLRVPKQLIAAVDYARENAYGFRRSRQAWIMDAVLARLKSEKRFIKKELEEEVDYSLLLFSLTPALLKAIDQSRISSFGQKKSRSAWILESMTKKIENQRTGVSEVAVAQKKGLDPFSTAEATQLMLLHNWQRLHLLIAFKPSNQKVPNLKELIIKELQEAVYDLNQVDMVGWTPLHYAVRENKGENLTALLLKSPKIEVNSLDFLKNSPLYYAVGTHNISAIQALLKHPKIDLQQKNWENETALALAKRKKFFKIVKLLEEREGTIRS